MKTTLQKLPKSRIKITISLTQDEMTKYYDAAYEKLAPSVTIKGFRPGKAPKEMTINSIGPERISHEALDLALPETLTEAMKKEDLISVSPPAINIKSMVNGLEYEAEIDVWPEVKLGDYKKLKIKLPAEEAAKDEEAETILKHLQKQKAEFVEVDRGAKKGDRIEIDFTGKLGGVVKEKLTSMHHPIILGEGTLIPGFEEQLEGLKKGENKTFKIKFPKDHPDEEMKDKEAEFEVKVHVVQEIILPEIDDKLAKDFGQKDVAAMKVAIKDSIAEEKKQRREQEIETMVVEKLLTITKADVPENLIEQELDRVLQRMEHEASQYGLTMDQYLAQMKKTREELRKEWRERAEKNVLIGLALGEVAKAEGIDREEKDVAKKVMEKLIEYLTK